MKRFIMNKLGNNFKKPAILAGIGVVILLLFLYRVKAYTNKAVVTAANEGKNIKTEAKEKESKSNPPQKQPEKVKKDEVKEIKPEEKKDENSKPPVNNSNQEKNAFLTFDDGPNGKVTPQVLEVLKKYDVKATFFVTGKAIEKNKDLLLREKQEGHAIGNHTYCHDYQALYSSPNVFLQDLAKNEELIRSVVGDFNNKLIRFPGGSFDKSKSAERQAVTEAGYHYIDWNCLNGDAEALNVPVERLVEKIKQTSQGKNRLVILMHDAGGKETTVQALPQIIEYLKAQGYNFKTLE